MNTVNLKNTPVSILETKENQAIAKLVAKGYQNPREDIQQIQSLEFETANGDKCRKFIVDFVELSPNQIKRSQVRDKEYDEDYCNEQLKPLIEAEGLKFVPHISEQLNLETGHNRLPVLMEIYPGQKLWFLKVSKPYVEQKDGSYKLATNTAFKDLVSKIRSNSPPPNNPYNMQGAAIQVEQLYREDPTFEGLNPTGNWLDQDESAFNAVMDWLHPGQFRSKGTRTKILKMASKGQSIIRPVEFSDWTHAATSIGWPSGVKPGKTKPSRMSFVEWVDPSDNTCITHVSTNGNKLNEKVTLELFEMYLTNTLSSTKGVKILMKVNAPNTNILALNKQRRDFVSKTIDPLNTKLRNKDFPEILECFWVQQLNHPSDSGLHFKQNSSGILE